MKKVLICLCLAICLLAGCVPENAVSEDGKIENTRYSDVASSGVWL